MCVKTEYQNFFIDISNKVFDKKIVINFKHDPNTSTLDLIQEKGKYDLKKNRLVVDDTLSNRIYLNELDKKFMPVVNYNFSCADLVSNNDKEVIIKQLTSNLNIFKARINPLDKGVYEVFKQGSKSMIAKIDLSLCTLWKIERNKVKQTINFNTIDFEELPF